MCTGTFHLHLPGPGILSPLQTDLLAVDVSTRQAEGQLSSLQTTVSEMQTTLATCRANLDLSASRLDKVSAVVAAVVVSMLLFFYRVLPLLNLC